MEGENSAMQFTRERTFALENYGWGSNARFFPDCKKALVMYAKRAFFLVDLLQGHYEKGHWELSDSCSIDYDGITIDHDGVFCYSSRDYQLYFLDLYLRKIHPIISDIQIERRIPLARCKEFLAYADDKGIYVYSLAEKKTISHLQMDVDDNSKMLFHPTGNYIVCMNSDHVSALDTKSGSLLWQKNPSEWFVKGDYWEFTPDGQYFILCPYEANVRVYNAHTGDGMAMFRKGNDETVTQAHLRADAKYLITSSYDRKIRVWDFEQARTLGGKSAYRPLDRYDEDGKVLVQTIDGHDERGVTAVSPNPDFSVAISYTDWDWKFYLWNLHTGELLDTLSFEMPIDDYKIIWRGRTASLFVAENTEGFSLGRMVRRTTPPFIRISETVVS
jgi:WD40 repeat protein